MSAHASDVTISVAVAEAILATLRRRLPHDSDPVLHVAHDVLANRVQVARLEAERLDRWVDDQSARDPNKRR